MSKASETYTMVDVTITKLKVEEGICVDKRKVFSINATADLKTKELIKKVLEEV